MRTVYDNIGLAISSICSAAGSKVFKKTATMGRPSEILTTVFFIVLLKFDKIARIFLDFLLGRVLHDLLPNPVCSLEYHKCAEISAKKLNSCYSTWPHTRT